MTSSDMTLKYLILLLFFVEFKKFQILQFGIFVTTIYDQKNIMCFKRVPVRAERITRW